MRPLEVYVAGIGVWSECFTNLSALAAWLQGSCALPSKMRPAAALLSPNERRRAPQSVLLAMEVAGQALTMSGFKPSSLACVFSSSHGDQAITDYMCQTLASCPDELSPTHFHHSVHNAAVGYWTIATGCHAPSSALSAGKASMGAGLLEAVIQVNADQRPVLLICSDMVGSGALSDLTDCTACFASALIFAPRPTGASQARLIVSVEEKQITDDNKPSPRIWQGKNPAAQALPLLSALLHGHGRCKLAVADDLQLLIDVEPSA